MLNRALLVPALVLAASPLFAQANPRGEAKVTLDGKTVSIDYGRPSLRGRDMLGRAEVGQSWRMGADAATTLKTEADLAFGAATVPKGDYILTAKKLAPDTWQLNVHKSNPDRTVVAEVPLTKSTLPESVEMFTIELTGKDKAGELALKWGTTSLATPFAAK